MKEIAPDIDRWRAAGLPIAVARLVDVDGSGPRLPGAAMAVSGDGVVAGSVSGGCVESAVVEASLAALESGERAVITFGYSDDDAFAVGLTCGGVVDLFVEPLDWWDVYDEAAWAAVDDDPLALVTVVAGPNVGAKLLVRIEESRRVIGSLGDPDLDRVVARDARGELAAGSTGVRHYGPQGQAGEEAVTLFVESFVPPPRMFVFGAVDFTAALAKVAKVLGYHVTVCDAREVFATRARFPMADDVVVDWPQRVLDAVGATLGPRDAVCILTHDAKFDVPAIVAALATDVGYIGVMGSRHTHEQRLERLREEGVDDVGLARLMAPIGLDLGSRTPEETALSICAEILATQTGRAGGVRSLRDGAGPIH